MVFGIVLVGCGNLGSRHLQALKKTRRPISITVCEPSETARNTARERYAQVEENEQIKGFCMLEDYRSLEGDYDLAIIATNAAGRYEIAEWLVEHLSLRYLILEKVVFQALPEFDLFRQKIKDRHAKVWVNCPRRMYEYYQELQPKLAGEKRIDMTVSGGSWGMGSNAIHLLDLYSYLTHFTEYRSDISGLEKGMTDSKRSGYKEFFGELRFYTDKGDVSIRCDHGMQPVEVKLTSSKGEITVREAEGVIRYQSNLTNLAAEQLIDSGECVLTDYEESAFLHKAVLESFLDHINQSSDEEVQRCPIT